MNRMLGAAVATVLVAGSAASAELVLHMDVNNIRAQATNGGGVNGPFGGLAHTGAVQFSFQSGTSILAALDIHNGTNPPINQNPTGALTNFTGVINLSNGMVTGGNLTVTAGGDTYTAQIVPNVGAVSPYIGGGFKIEGLTFQGMFSGPTFAGVDVSPWFNFQGSGGLPGSFLQFNFQPDANGFSFADIDLFVAVTAIPLPPAGWAGLATLAGVMIAGYVRRR